MADADSGAIDKAIDAEVVRVHHMAPGEIECLTRRFGLHVVVVEPEADIPGSYWGGSEAGLIQNRLYVRADTPIHSLLHEACHFICMDSQRRGELDRDAAGDFAEENAVCYLQILLADYIPGVGRLRMCQDMDAWGYTFRLGSAHTWFEHDAEDAKRWLITADLVDDKLAPKWHVRVD